MPRCVYAQRPQTAHLCFTVWPQQKDLSTHFGPQRVKTTKPQEPLNSNFLRSPPLPAPPSSCKSKVPPPPPPCLPYGFVQAPKQTKVRRKSDQDGKLLSSARLFNTWLQRGAMQRAERHYRRRAPNYALQCWSAEFSTE